MLRMGNPGNANAIHMLMSARRDTLERKEMSIQPPEKALSRYETGGTAERNHPIFFTNGLRFGLRLSGFFFFFFFFFFSSQ
jgi:hypothetical protein